MTERSKVPKLADIESTLHPRPWLKRSGGIYSLILNNLTPRKLGGKIEGLVSKQNLIPKSNDRSQKDPAFVAI